MTTSAIPVFIINLESDVSRREQIIFQFTSLVGFRPIIVKGIQGSILPKSVCLALSQDELWSARKGTIGCFLSHVSAWEKVSSISEPFAVILEDDTNVSNLGLLHQVSIPTDAEIVFIHDRMSTDQPPDRAGPQFLPMWRALEYIDQTKRGPGAEGYALTPNGAKKLITSCTRDLYFGHVDGRLLRYSTTEDDLRHLAEGSWIASVIRNHHSKKLPPPLGLLRAYCTSPALVEHLNKDSSREAEDVRVSI